jgi:hypothetical protein
LYSVVNKLLYILRVLERKMSEKGHNIKLGGALIAGKEVVCENRQND